MLDGRKCWRPDTRLANTGWTVAQSCECIGLRGQSAGDEFGVPEGWACSCMCIRGNGHARMHTAESRRFPHITPSDAPAARFCTCHVHLFINYLPPLCSSCRLYYHVDQQTTSNSWTYVPSPLRWLKPAHKQKSSAFFAPSPPFLFVMCMYVSGVIEWERLPTIVWR